MEDVGRRRAVSGLLFQFILCACCIINSVVFAATQGAIGQTSVGSVSISVHIPRTVRLFANPTSLSTSSNTNYCLSVIDANAPSGPNYYRVNASGSSSVRLLNNIQSKWLQLNNMYGLPKGSIASCQTYTLLVDAKPSNEDQANLVVLMLVPE